MQKRIKLVGLVVDGVTITKAAKMLHVKRPTVKIIIKRYLRSGTYFQKKMPVLKTKNTPISGDNTKIEEVSI
jgi:transposase